MNRVTILAGLLTALPAFGSKTFDLLQPQWQGTWQTVTLKTLAEKVPPLKSVFAQDTGWLTVSRPGGLFNPAIFSTHFGKDGPLPVGAKTLPEVTLSETGDTIGVRIVLAYNEDACRMLIGNPIRLALANSQATRQDRPFLDVKNPVFDDDSGWCLHFGQGMENHTLYQRSHNPGAYQGYVATSFNGGKPVKTWPGPPPVGLIKPNEPFEAIFSLTKTGPEEIKAYGFIATHEMEHTLTGVKDFTFDALYFHFPNGKAGPNASLTIREFKLITP